MPTSAMITHVDASAYWPIARSGSSQTSRLGGSQSFSPPSFWFLFAPEEFAGITMPKWLGHTALVLR